MTRKQKIAAYDTTLDMLEATAKTMQFYKDTSSLSEHGIGSLDRIYNTIKWLKGEMPDIINEEEPPC